MESHRGRRTDGLTAGFMGGLEESKNDGGKNYIARCGGADLAAEGEPFRNRLLVMHIRRSVSFKSSSTRSEARKQSQ